MNAIQQRELHNAKMKQLMKSSQGLFVVTQVVESLKKIESLIETLPTPQDKNAVINHVTNVWADKMRMNTLTLSLPTE